MEAIMQEIIVCLIKLVRLAYVLTQGISLFLMATGRIQKDSDRMKAFRETSTTSSSRRGVPI